MATLFGKHLLSGTEIAHARNLVSQIEQAQSIDAIVNLLKSTDELFKSKGSMELQKTLEYCWAAVAPSQECPEVTASLHGL